MFRFTTVLNFTLSYLCFKTKLSFFPNNTFLFFKPKEINIFIFLLAELFSLSKAPFSPWDLHQELVKSGNFFKKHFFFLLSFTIQFYNLVYFVYVFNWFFFIQNSFYYFNCFLKKLALANLNTRFVH